MLDRTINYSTFLMCCRSARTNINVKGILIFNMRAAQTLTVAGWPFARISAVNDNEAAP